MSCSQGGRRPFEEQRPAVEPRRRVTVVDRLCVATSCRRQPCCTAQQLVMRRPGTMHARDNPEGLPGTCGQLASSCGDVLWENLCQQAREWPRHSLDRALPPQQPPAVASVVSSTGTQQMQQHPFRHRRTRLTAAAPTTRVGESLLARKQQPGPLHHDMPAQNWRPPLPAPPKKCARQQQHARRGRPNSTTHRRPKRVCSHPTPRLHQHCFPPRSPALSPTNTHPSSRCMRLRCTRLRASRTHSVSIDSNTLYTR